MGALSRSVLILEDDLDLAQQWADYLAAFGYRCDLAFNRREAELLCEERAYDAVIVDMFFRDENGRLSGDGGLTFITHLRLPSLAGTPRWGERVPIITVTGSDGIVDALGHARNAGADRTFRKPFNPAVLVDALSTLVGAKAPNPGDL